MTPVPVTPLRVALGEYDTGWHDPATSLARAAAVVGAAASAGAHLVVLPEMCTTGFTMDSNRAEPVDGESVARLRGIAAEAGVWVLAGVATRAGEPCNGADPCRARNSAIVFDPRGAIAAVYHKRRLFAYAGEHQHYEPGESHAVIAVEGVRVSPFICYELRFPELFRAVAPETDLMLLIANWPAARRSHWDTLVRARAIESQCYVIAVNRTGEGGGLMYDGGSAAYDPWGDLVPPVARADGIMIVEVDPDTVARVRAAYPFLADAAPARELRGR